MVTRQHPPAAKGYAFLTVEDLVGMVNVVIAPDVYTRDRAALQSAFVLIDGGCYKGITEPHRTAPTQRVQVSTW